MLVSRVWRNVARVAKGTLLKSSRGTALCTNLWCTMCVQHMSGIALGLDRRTYVARIVPAIAEYSAFREGPNLSAGCSDRAELPVVAAAGGRGGSAASS